jgi:predicted phage terminase large subunit-like protein
MAVKELTADRDKLSRSLPLQARMEAGQVWLPTDAQWLGELERELLAFPNGRHDDQVDTLAYAALVSGQPREPHIWFA